MARPKPSGKGGKAGKGGSKSKMVVHYALSGETYAEFCLLTHNQAQVAGVAWPQ
jgi:hypothetical protein